jgi:hypothetical protein
MYSVRGVLLCAVLAGSGGLPVLAAAEDQPVPSVYVAPENEGQGETERPAVHCEGQNCLPPEDNPVQECEGQDCTPAPLIEHVE